MGKFSTWLEDRGRYVIKHKAIDGKSSKTFSNLQDVAKYVKSFDMGPVGSQIYHTDFRP
jgi:hypothetical protein